MREGTERGEALDEENTREDPKKDGEVLILCRTRFHFSLFTV